MCLTFGHLMPLRSQDTAQVGQDGPRRTSIRVELCLQSVIIIISVFAQMSPGRRQTANCNCQWLLNEVKQRLSWSVILFSYSPLHPTPLRQLLPSSNRQLLLACRQDIATFSSSSFVLGPLSPAHCNWTSAALAYQSLSSPSDWLPLSTFVSLAISVSPLLPLIFIHWHI